MLDVLARFEVLEACEIGKRSGSAIEGRHDRGREAAIAQARSPGLPARAGRLWLDDQSVADILQAALRLPGFRCSRREAGRSS